MQYWESEMRMLFHTAVDRLLRCLSSTMGSLKADRPPACTVPEHFVLYIHGNLTGLVQDFWSKLITLHTLRVLLYL